MWFYEAMSDTCNKNMTESFESVNIAIALHKVLSEEWLFAKHVKTGWIIGLNKSFKGIRDMLSDSLPNSLPTGLCVMSKSLTEGSLNTEFKFYQQDSCDENWVGYNENVFYRLDPCDCLYLLTAGSEVAYEYKTANGEVVRVDKRILDEKGLSPGALNTKWRRIQG